MKSRVNYWMPFAALALLPGCNIVGGKPADQLPVAPSNGPGADYPVVLGEPFTIGAQTYTPEDVLNYDAVGYALVSDAPGNRVWAAHKTLPLPSYAEVTDLDSGKTILVRVEKRGPMVNDRLVELSQAAAAQLGIEPGARAAVRLRRVNPPEAERALLRSGEQAPARMDTPAPLLAVLKRKLQKEEPLGAERAPGTAASPSAPPPVPTPLPVAVPKPIAPRPSSTPAPKPASAPKPAHVAEAGKFVVQVAAFSTRQRADKTATALGGFVTKPGQYWYVRLGPFASRGKAESALEKARRAGYGDARIQRTD